MKAAIIFILGLLSVPVIRFVLDVLGVFWRAGRDTVRHWRLPLREGYRWWCWFYLTPVIWWDMLKTQGRAWWGGYSTEIELYDAK